MKNEIENLRRMYEAALPAEAVVADPVVIDQLYRRNVTALDRRIPLVLRPSTEPEVERIVALANEHRTPLYPFSTGKNWGLAGTRESRQQPIRPRGVPVATTRNRPISRGWTQISLFLGRPLDTCPRMRMVPLVRHADFL